MFAICMKKVVAKILNFHSDFNTFVKYRPVHARQAKELQTAYFIKATGSKLRTLRKELHIQTESKNNNKYI